MISSLTLTALPKGHGPAQAGILGHVGIGHVHSISGFVHDDSVGFAVTVSLMRDALPVDVRVTDVHADPDTGWIEVHTADGGKGRARPRRGVTPAQVDILRRAVGQDAMCCQNLAIHTLGRMYGQGVHEEAACFQAAAAYAVLDTFVQRWPDHADLVEDIFEDNVDMALGMCVRRGPLELALMAVINHTAGGLGPNENSEGSVPYGSAKAALMTRLGLQEAPSFMVESKAYVPAICGNLHNRSLLVRANRTADNMVMAELLRDAGKAVGVPMQHDFDAYPRHNDMLGIQTRKLATIVEDLGRALSRAVNGRDKVRITGELARLVSEDLGGVSFMSDAIHNIVGSGGMMPGSGAMLSMLIPRSEADHWKIPVFMPEDMAAYRAVLLAALDLLPARLDEAKAAYMAKRQAFPSAKHTTA